jgi:hypothetical protein
VAHLMDVFLNRHNLTAPVKERLLSPRAQWVDILGRNGWTTCCVAGGDEGLYRGTE